MVFYTSHGECPEVLRCPWDIKALKHQDAFPGEGKALKLYGRLPEFCITVKRHCATGTCISATVWYKCFWKLQDRRKKHGTSMGWAAHNQVETPEVFVKFYPEHSKMLWHSVASDRILRDFSFCDRKKIYFKVVKECNFSENFLLDLLWSSSSSGFTDNYCTNLDSE